MIEVNGILVEKAILTGFFLCDISKCKGECCTFPGEFGAPLEISEVPILDAQVSIVKRNLSEKSLKWIEERGTSELRLKRYTTVCIEKRDCVFVYYEKDIALCSIEKEFLEGNTNFRKPISCWLFPIRVGRHQNTTYLYYEKIPECSDAVKNGKKQGVKIYQALKNPLISAFGLEWYRELERQAATI